MLCSVPRLPSELLADTGIVPEDPVERLLFDAVLLRQLEETTIDFTRKLSTRDKIMLRRRMMGIV